MSESHSRPSFSKKSFLSSSNVMTKISDVPIQCLSSYSVLQASQLMNESRVHCIIVNDSVTNKLCGLVTAKDLAFRVVADELSPQTTVDKIMTQSPYIASVNTSANEALRLMVTKKIRHLPLVDDFGVVVGMLNITKCFYHAMIRLEKMSLEAKKLQCTFDELRETSLDVENSGSSSIEFSKYSLVDRVTENEDEDIDPLVTTEASIDFGIMKRKKKIVNDLKRLIDVMKQPDLKSILTDDDLDIKPPTIIDTKTSILDAAKLLKDSKVTAVLICDKPSLLNQCDHIIGILTSKDIAFRVLASNIDPKTTNIVRVMTPKPNFADETLGIHTALRLMYEGKFLNLPVKNSSDMITGLVSVLQLTYALLKTLDGSHFSSSSNFSADDLIFEVDTNENISVNSYENGPAWNRFWGSLDQPLSTVESNEKKTSRRGSYNNIRRHSSSDRRYSSNIKTSSSANNTPPPSVPSIGPMNIQPTKRNSNLSNAFKHSIQSTKSDSTTSTTIINPDRATYDSTLPNNRLETIKQQYAGHSQKEIKIKLRIREKLDLNLNNKIYKMKVYPNDDKDLLQQLRNHVIRKLDINGGDYYFDLSYIDEDNDIVSLDKNEDLETAIDSNFDRMMMLLDIRDKFGSLHRIRSRDSFFTDTQEASEKVNAVLLIGTVILGVIVLSRFMSK